MRTWRVIAILGLVLALAGCGLVEQLLPPQSPPGNLSASTGTHPDHIVISWQAVELATRYEIERAETEDGPYTLVGTSSTTSYSDAVETQGKWYWYRVRACNDAGCGPWSAPVRGYAGRPPAPENVLASQGDFSDKIRISWDPVPGATHYQVFRDRVENGTYNEVVASAVEENFVYDTNVHPATWYWYRVRACKGGTCSVLSQAAGGYCGPSPIPFAEDEKPY